MAKLHRLFFETEYDKYIKTLPIGDQIKIHEQEEAEEEEERRTRVKYEATMNLLMYNLIREEDRAKLLAARKMTEPKAPRNNDMNASPLAKYASSAGFVPEEATIGYAVLPEDIQPLIDICIAQCITPNAIRKCADDVMKLSDDPQSPYYLTERERAEMLLSYYIDWSKRYNRGVISRVAHGGIKSVAIKYKKRYFNVSSDRIYITDINDSDGTTGFFASLLRGICKMHDTPEDYLILTAKQMRNGRSEAKQLPTGASIPVCFSFAENGSVDKVIVIDPLYYTDELNYLHRKGITCGLEESEK